MTLSAAQMAHLGPRSITLLVLIDYRSSILAISDQKVTVVQSSRSLVPTTRIDTLSPRAVLLLEEIDKINRFESID